MSRRLFLFGMGYTGAYIAELAIKNGFSVCATVRDENRAMAITQYGIPCHAFDGHNMDSDMVDDLVRASHIISTVPPQSFDPVIAPLSRALEGRDDKWLGYLSSTGVYGDHDGGVVTEQTPPPKDLNIHNQWRLDAEQAWVNFAHENAHRLAIFRVSGIYGKGRNLVEKALKGDVQRIYKAGHVFNRIHVEDIAGAVTLAMTKRRNNKNAVGIFNLADNMPSPAAIVCEYACGLVGKTPPPRINYADANLSPMAKQFWESSRIVDNTRIKEELGYDLKYPTYRHGLQAIYNQLELY